MLVKRNAADRGAANHGWLDTRHSFSFADYFDPRHMGFRSLRVINDDRIAPAAGFDTHGHRDMEIVTYLLDGELAHKDSTGTVATIAAGEVQRMTAGRGIRHSEFNASREHPVRLLQIWILPEVRNLEPGYEQQMIPDDEKRGRLRLVASRDGRDGSLTIHQDASILATILRDGESVRHELAPGRGAWVQVATGKLTVNGVALAEGDGAAIEDEAVVEIAGAGEGGEALLFDLK